MNNIVKKAIAECFGTFVLVFIACGTAAYINDAGATSIAFGLVIVAMAYSIGRISGCHINPAVSLGCLLAKRMTLKDFLVYVCAQIVGAFLGAVAVFGIFKLGNYDFALAAKLGETKAVIGDASNYAIGSGAGVEDYPEFAAIFASLLAEVILTCIFVYVILNVTAEKAKTGKIAGIIIGATLALVHFVGCGITGTSVNPARSIATAITSAIYGNGTNALAQVWIFIVGPLIGGALAALVYNVLHKEDKEADPMANANSEDAE